MLPLQAKGHISQNCRERKYSNNEKYEKAEKAINGEKDDLVLYLLTMENKKENVKKKVWFMEMLSSPLRLERCVPSMGTHSSH